MQTLVEDKFGYVLDAETFRHLPRMPLFLALQHHVIIFSDCIHCSAWWNLSNGIMTLSVH